MFQLRLRHILVFVALVPVSIFLLLDPVPINLILIALAWTIGVICLIPQHYRAERGTTSHLLSRLLIICGAIMFGGTSFDAIVHSTDPIGHEAPW